MSGQVKCSECAQQIDPDVCWCGETKLGAHDNHTFIPMGCDCFRDEAIVRAEVEPLAKAGMTG